MEGESFTNQYGAGKMNFWKHKELDAANVTEGDQRVAIIKLAHATKWFLRIAMVLIVVYIIITVTNAVPVMWRSWKKLAKGDVSSFTQKEGLQYLGATANIVRGDLENNQDSLAEKALRRQMAMTELATPPAIPLAPKATFVGGGELTPEERLKRQLAGQA